MCQVKNKFVVASLALASGGILACTAAVLGVLLPSGSAATFVATIALLGLIVAVLVAAFAWLCDRIESRDIDWADTICDTFQNKEQKIHGPDRLASRDVRLGGVGFRPDVRLHSGV